MSILVLPTWVLTDFLTATKVEAADVPTKIVFTTNSQAINTNSISSVITVQTQDSGGNSSQVPSTTHLDISTTSSTGSFSSNSSTWVGTNRLTMNSGSANRNFYYQDSSSGTFTITVTVEEQPTWAPVQQIIVVNDPTITNAGLSINGGAPATRSATVGLNLSAVGAIKMSFDNGVTWLDYATAYSYLLPEGDGTKIISVIYQDANGHNSKPVSASIILDTSSPRVTLNKIAATVGIQTWNSSSVLSGQAEDQTSGIRSVSIEIINQTDNTFWDTNTLDNSENGWTPITDENLPQFNYIASSYDKNGPWSFPLDAKNMTDGDNYTVMAKATDYAYNEATTEPVNFTYKSTLPTVSVSKLPNLETLNTDYTLSASFSDDATIREYRVDGNGWQDYKSAVVVTAEGAHTFEARATDIANNIVTASTDFTIDKTPPANPSVLINGGAAYTNSGSVNLSLNAIGATEMSFDNGLNWEPFASTKTVGLSAGDGQKTISVIYRDAVGNQIAANGNIILDTVKPTVVLSDDRSDNFVRNGDTVDFTATFTDLNGLAGTPAISIGSALNSIAMTPTANPLVWTYSWVVPIGHDGNYTVAISASDQAGNTNASATSKTNYIIDNASPVASVNLAQTSFGPASWNNANTIQGTATDTNLDSVFVSIQRNSDSRNWDPTKSNWYSGSYVWMSVTGLNNWVLNFDKANLASGAYTIRVKAVDKVGKTNSSPSYPSVIFTYDNTSPVITLNGASIVNLNLNQGYVEAGATAIDNTDGIVAVTVDGSSVNPAVAGNYAVSYQAADSFGNIGKLTRTVVVLPTTKMIAADTTNLTKNTPTVVIPINKTSDTNVIVPAEVTNATVDLSELLNNQSSTVTLLGAINIDAVTSAGQIQVTLPAGMQISGDANWTGVINVPTVIRNAAVNFPAVNNMTSTLNSAVEIGFGDTKLTFDKAVRILMAGQAGKSAGFVRGGVFTSIANICSSDSQSTGNTLASGADCKIDNGSDLIIWTKHFTEFVTYTQTPVTITVTSLSDKSTPKTVAPSQTVEPTPVAVTPDSQGIVKGVEAPAAADESTNWTPWIVLFVLIILAGAATGGYFYWFSGKEETEKELKEIKPAKKIANTSPKIPVKTVNKSVRKQKRW